MILSRQTLPIIVTGSFNKLTSTHAERERTIYLSIEEGRDAKLAYNQSEKRRESHPQIRPEKTWSILMLAERTANTAKQNANASE